MTGQRFHPQRLAWCAKHKHYMDIEAVRRLADLVLYHARDPVAIKVGMLMCELREVNLVEVDEDA